MKKKEPGMFDVKLDGKESFTVDNIFTLGKMPIYIQEMNQGHNIKVPNRKKIEKTNSTDSLDETK